MSENGWTPGPWLIDQPLNEHVVSDDYHVIEAGPHGFQLSGFMSLADARLIAAAPALAEALEALAAEASLILRSPRFNALLGNVNAEVLGRKIAAADAALASAKGST